mgnify:CR=1 FL=1
MKIVFDTFAWVEYFNGSEIGVKVKQMLELQENEIFTSIMTIAELASALKRDDRDVEISYKIVKDLSKIYFIDLELAKEAGILHVEMRKKLKDFGMIDCLILLTARKLSAKILTGDPHFKGLKEARLI